MTFLVRIRHLRRRTGRRRGIRLPLIVIIIISINPVPQQDVLQYTRRRRRVPRNNRLRLDLCFIEGFVRNFRGWRIDHDYSAGGRDDPGGWFRYWRGSRGAFLFRFLVAFHPLRCLVVVRLGDLDLHLAVFVLLDFGCRDRGLYYCCFFGIGFFTGRKRIINKTEKWKRCRVPIEIW